MTQLKRARNSLLNVSKLPPEVLGNIFRWNVTHKHKFDGLEKESHNFLLVCHHWFEVASCTPELWGFWGNTPMDWARCCRRSATTPLDLVLDVDDGDGAFYGAVQSVLHDRATRDTIRLAHLRADNSILLNAVINSLTADCEGLQSNSMESFILHNDSDLYLDVTDLFAHYHFPKLRHLEAINCWISSWDHLSSRTGVLTTLSLDLKYPTPTPTASQLLSILASNPTLRKLSLSENAVPYAGGGKSSLRVPFHHLRELKLDGDLQDVFGLLPQLDPPRSLEHITVVLYCTVADISQTVGPYLRDYIRRRGRSRNGLGLFISQYQSSIICDVGDVNRLNPPTPVRERVAWFVSISVGTSGPTPGDLVESGLLDLIAHVPREEVAWFQGLGELVTMEDILAQFTNLRALHFSNMPLSAIFLKSHLGGDEEIFPSLQHVSLNRVVEEDDNWSLLTTSLARRASTGNCLCTLEITGSPHMCAEVVGSITDTVEEFWTDTSRQGCPFGACPEPQSRPTAGFRRLSHKNTMHTGDGPSCPSP